MTAEDADLVRNRIHKVEEMKECNPFDCFYEEDFSPIVRQMQKLQEQIDELAKRTKEIESRLTSYNINLEFEAVAKQLKQLKEITNRLQDDMKAGRKPHKCPTCFGYGTTQVMQNSISPFEQYTIDYLGRYFKSCVPCQGKGIVWG